MTVYNKLKIAILTIISSQHLYAITLDPLQIQSAPGELLYAEMSFHQADPNSKLEVGLATPEDLLMIGASHHPPANLNFFTRRNSRGEGTIVITSSRQMTDAELNIILKIKENGAANLKHIHQSMRPSTKTALDKNNNNEKPLTPKFVVSDKDIALSLPESTRFTTSSNTPEVKLKQETLLNAPYKLPPTMNISESKQSPSTTISVASPQIVPKVIPVLSKTPASNVIAATPEPIQKQLTTPAQPSENIQIPNNPARQNAIAATEQALSKSANTLIENAEKTKAEFLAKEAEAPAPAPAPAKKNISAAKISTITNKHQQHIVQQNESLWSIAQQISAQTQQPVAKVMQQIKTQNEKAFIGGNVNRLRQGSKLNLNLNTTPTQQTLNMKQLATQPVRPSAGKTKYRLQQAEMSLVAESNQDSSTGSAKKETLQQKISPDFSLKVMTAREKTVTLQRNVSQLEVALHQKEQRIQLLNARLAELQEELKTRQETKKLMH